MRHTCKRCQIVTTSNKSRVCAVCAQGASKPAHTCIKCNTVKTRRDSRVCTICDRKSKPCKSCGVACNTKYCVDCKSKVCKGCGDLTTSKTEFCSKECCSVHKRQEYSRDPIAETMHAEFYAHVGINYRAKNQGYFERGGTLITRDMKVRNCVVCRIGFESPYSAIRVCSTCSRLKR